MQFSSVVTFLTLAMSAAAAPAPAQVEVVARTTVEPCNDSTYKPYCCNNDAPTSVAALLLAQILGINVEALLSCTAAIVGGSCSQNVKCCTGTAVNDGFALIFVGNVQCIL